MFRAKMNSMHFLFLQLNTREIHKKSALHSLHRLLNIFTMSIQVNGNYVAREISCRKMCEGNWAIAKISSFKIRVGRAADRFIWIPWYIIIQHHAILCRLVFQPQIDPSLPPESAVEAWPSWVNIARGHSNPHREVQEQGGPS